MKREHEAPSSYDRAFTWEEVSWITGIPITLLLEAYSHRVGGKGAAYQQLPTKIDAQVLAAWLQSQPGLIREVA